MLLTVRRVLSTLAILNWGAVAAFLAIAALVTMFPDRFDAKAVTQFGNRAPEIRQGLVAILVLGSSIGVPVHIVFTRLIAMIDTARAGQPFVAENIRRLRHIAWAVLAIQVADLAFGYVSYWLTQMIGQVFAWNVSFTGWLAVLLLFVLARIFQQGAAMQEELAATV